MIRPIPINLLIHKCIYKSVLIDKYGNTTEVQSELKRVRFEPFKQTTFTSLGESKNDKMLMFYDCQNSRPKDFNFKELDRIVFKGIEFTIRAISEEYDNSRLHHLEINLV
jgi:hypothetical protein